jgi:hypothetical protein
MVLKRVQRSLKHAITSIPSNIFDSVNIHITDLHHTSIIKMLLWPKYLLEIIFRYILVCIIAYFVRNILIGWWLIHKKCVIRFYCTAEAEQNHVRNKRKYWLSQLRWQYDNIFSYIATHEDIRMYVRIPPIDVLTTKQ